MTLECKNIYHYTSQAGFLGIVGEKKIWATDSIFVNDSSELGYSVGLMKNILQTKINDASARLQSHGDPRELQLRIYLYNQLIEYVNKIEKNIKMIGIFIASFSTQSDLISQWRGRGGPHRLDNRRAGLSYKPPGYREAPCPPFLGLP
jgi:hypothetical protein